MASMSQNTNMHTEIKLGKIKKYAGDPEELNEFLGLLLATFEVNRHIYDNN
jgi:hypothetical protein